MKNYFYIVIVVIYLFLFFLLTLARANVKDILFFGQDISSPSVNDLCDGSVIYVHDNIGMDVKPK